MGVFYSAFCRLLHCPARTNFSKVCTFIACGVHYISTIPNSYHCRELLGWSILFNFLVPVSIPVPLYYTGCSICFVTFFGYYALIYVTSRDDPMFNEMVRHHKATTNWPRSAKVELIKTFLFLVSPPPKPRFFKVNGQHGFGFVSFNNRFNLLRYECGQTEESLSGGQEEFGGENDNRGRIGWTRTTVAVRIAETCGRKNETRSGIDKFRAI